MNVITQEDEYQQQPSSDESAETDEEEDSEEEYDDDEILSYHSSEDDEDDEEEEEDNDGPPGMPPGMMNFFRHMTQIAGESDEDSDEEEVEEVPDRRLLGPQERRRGPERDGRAVIGRTCRHLQIGNGVVDLVSCLQHHPVSTFRSLYIPHSAHEPS